MDTRRRALAALVAAPLIGRIGPAHGDRPKVVGYLSGGSDGAELVRALAALGRVEGRNMRFLVHVSRSDSPGTAAGSAARIVEAAPDVIVTYTSYRALALMRATRTIPIVCGGVGDPVSYGLARSIARPGYNVTGLSNSAVEAMRLMVELLRSVRPGLARVVFLRHRTDPLHTPGVKTFRPAIEGAGLEAVEVVAAGQAEFEQAVESRREPAREAVLLMIPPEVDRPRVAAAAIRRRIPLLGFGDDDFIEDGGLMSLGMDYIDRTRRVAEITEKILRGANPAEIPFELPDRTHLCINRRTAARIGIELPASMLLRASRVI